MSWNFGYKRIKMSNDRLENILLIKINDPVLRKIHKDFNNILVSLAIKSLLSKKELAMESMYYKQRKPWKKQEILIWSTNQKSSARNN